MNIDEAIEHCKNIARESDCKCALEHKQLAEWLEELKAFRWHYPSKGELPPRGEQVLCRLWNNNYVLAFIREDKEWTTNGKNAFDGVKCWQEIVSPKENIGLNVGTKDV